MRSAGEKGKGCYDLLIGAWKMSIKLDEGLAKNTYVFLTQKKVNLVLQ